MTFRHDGSMPRPRLLTRRCLLGALAAAGFAAPLVSGGRVQAARLALADPGGPYRVPGGRIGFLRPQGVVPLTNGWLLLSEDHAFQIQVREHIFVSGALNPMWDRDDRSVPLATPQVAGFNARKVRDKRYEPGPDYADESIILNDGAWIGEVCVTTSTVGGSITDTAGLVARWRAAMDLVLGGVSVRKAPALATALSEFAISLDTAGLNPRLTGEQLVLSLKPPHDDREALGAGIASIVLPNLGILDYISAEANDDMLDLYRAMGTETQTPGGRGITAAERKRPDGMLTTIIRVFGKRRQQEMIAVYPAVDRTAALTALDRAFRSFRFTDEG